MTVKSVEDTLPVEVLIDRITARTARIGVIGLGYVGLPLVLVFEEAGFEVLGFDVDTKKVDALNRGDSYIRHIGVERISRSFRRKARATVDFKSLADCDAII